MDNKEEKLKYMMAELIEKGNLAIIDELFAPDYIAHAGGKQFSGHAFLK